MKNKGLIITLIILLTIVIIGLVSFLVLILSGKLDMLAGFKNIGIKSNNVVFDEVYELEKIDNLEILSSTSNIDFKESTDGNIRIVAYGQNDSDLKVNLDKNRLKVDYSEYKISGFGFNFYSNDIIVYIPSDYSKEININNNYGDCEMIDLENATITIDASCGNVKLGKVKNVTIKCDYGDVKIATVLNKVSIESNCGNVNIDKIQIEKDSSIKSDYGDVKIRETNDIYIDAKTDLGDAKVNNNNRHSAITLKIEADCGNVKVGD